MRLRAKHATASGAWYLLSLVVAGAAKCDLASARSDRIFKELSLAIEEIRHSVGARRAGAET